VAADQSVLETLMTVVKCEKEIIHINDLEGKNGVITSL